VPACPSFTIAAAAQRLAAPAVPAPGQCRSLLDHLARLANPGQRRGRRHALGAVQAVAVAAVLAVARSLAALGVRSDPLRRACRPPGEATVRRVLARAEFGDRRRPGRLRGRRSARGGRAGGLADPGRAGRTTAWHLLADDCDYADPGGDDFVCRDADHARKRAVAQLQALDDHVTLEPSPHGREFPFSGAGLGGRLPGPWLP
jgi:hypothetical protein